MILYDTNLKRIELCRSEIDRERRRQAESRKIEIVKIRQREDSPLRRLEDRVILERLRQRVVW